MNVVGAFESSAPVMFHISSSKARAAAIDEAAITNAMLCDVLSVRVEHQYVYFRGQTSKHQLRSRLTGAVDDAVRLLTIGVKEYGYFHTSWDQILNLRTPLGYFNFFPPVRVIEQGISTDDGADISRINISIELPKKAESLLPRIYGPRLCDECGEPIDSDRIKALPNTSHCVQCATSIEKRR
jgi:hypothetical protein